MFCQKHSYWVYLVQYPPREVNDTLYGTKMFILYNLVKKSNSSYFWSYSHFYYFGFHKYTESDYHRWELRGDQPVLTMAIVIYHYVEIIWRILVNPNFGITYTITNKYYPGETVHINIQSLINMIQVNYCVITTKKGKGELTRFCGNG